MIICSHGWFHTFSPWRTKHVIFPLICTHNVLPSWSSFIINSFTILSLPCSYSINRKCVSVAIQSYHCKPLPFFSQFPGSSLNQIAMCKTQESVPTFGLVITALTFQETLHLPSWPILRAHCSSFNSQTFFLEEGIILGNQPIIFKNRNISKIFFRVRLFLQ